MKNIFLDFEPAKLFVRNLNLTCQKDWTKWCKNNDTKFLKIPTNPNVYYKDTGWMSLSDWLGIKSYKNIRNINYLSYSECKKYVLKNFCITNKTKWAELDKDMLPLFIPKRPDHVYKNKGWINWEDFLNSSLSPRSKSKLFMSFRDAKEYVLSLEFKNEYEYYEFIKKNNINFLPLRPDSAYSNFWTGYIDFLGCDTGRKSFGEDKIKKVLDKYGSI